MHSPELLYHPLWENSYYPNNLKNTTQENVRTYHFVVPTAIYRQPRFVKLFALYLILV